MLRDWEFSPLVFNMFLFSIVALAFVVAAIFAYRKNWKFSFSFSLVAVAFFCALAHPSTQSFLRTAVWATFFTSVEKLHVGLATMNKTINEIRLQMNAEQKAREKQQEQLDDVQKRILQSQSRLDRQAKHLADTDALLKVFYEKKVTETFKQSKDSERLIVLSHGSNRTSVYILLLHNPIPQTIDINWDVFDQLSDAWEIDGNIVTLRWREPPQDFYKKRMLVSYIPDPKNDRLYDKLSKKEDRVFADGLPLFYGYYNLDPVVSKYMYEHGLDDFDFSLFEKHREEIMDFLRKEYKRGK